MTVSERKVREISLPPERNVVATAPLKDLPQLETDLESYSGITS
jgi:hypothetical protein